MPEPFQKTKALLAKLQAAAIEELHGELIDEIHGSLIDVLRSLSSEWDSIPTRQRGEIRLEVRAMARKIVQKSLDIVAANDR